MTPQTIGSRTRLPGASRCGRTRMRLWPALDPAKLIMRLLTDAEFLAEAAQGILGPEEQQLIMMNKPPRSVASRPLVSGRRDLDR